MRSRLGRNRVLRGVAALTLLMGVLWAAEPASAVHDEGFALQGDVDDATLLDWVDFFNADGSLKTLPNTYLASSFEDDWQLADTSAYATGSKDDLPISVAGSDWECKKSNNIGPKFEMLNAYAAARRPTSGDSANDLLIYFGSEISSPNGSRNTGIWLLQDENVGCTAAGGGGTEFTGSHRDGDVFIVSAFTNGGTQANIDVYEWVDSTPNDGDADLGGSLQPHSAFPNATCPLGTPPQGFNDDACAIVNTSAEVDTPWNSPDATGGNLDINEFFEGGINLSNLGLDTCFSTVVMNSRSSHEPGATLHDFVADDFETCGNLKVRKYIDVDYSGTRNAGDVTAGTPVAGWSFTVTRLSDNTVVCTGTTTSAAGELTCTTGSLQNMTPGQYQVTETQQTGMFNTDPGPFDEGATVSKTITVGLADQTVDFGNTCYVDKTFRINNVPTGTGALKVDWSVSSGPNSGASGTVDLVQTTNTASGSLNDTLTQSDVLSWSWYLASDSGNKVTGATDELLGGGYPTCAKLNQANFPFVTITGTKYKDVDADGVGPEPDPDGQGPLIAEGPLEGFQFKLMQGNTQIGTTQSSNAQGVFSFTNVAPGTYTVVEVAKAGWLQTEPVFGNGISVTVTLTSPATVNLAGQFGNAPLSDIAVNFNPQTAFTDSTISCTGPAQPTGGTALSGSTTDGSYNSNGLVVGTYNCTVVIVDP